MEHARTGHALDDESAATLDEILDSVDLAALRARRSEKWSAVGPDVLAMWIAEMDFPRAEPIVRALHQAIDRDETGYAPSRATALTAAFAGFAERRFGWCLDPGGIAVVPDVIVGVEEVLGLLTGPGDAVAMHTPSYPPFYEMLAHAGRELAAAPLQHGQRGWQIDLDALEAAFASGARVYLLINPHNPTGRVFPAAELAPVVELAERYRVPIIADEVHAPLVLAGAVHTPLTSMGGWATEAGVVFSSASKAFDLAGLKCALAVAESPRMRSLLNGLPATMPYQASVLGVIAGQAAFTAGDEWLDAVLRRLDANRALLRRLLQERLPAIRWTQHEASYLAWLDCRGLGLGPDPAAAILERAGVAVNSGRGFGEAGRDWVRMNTATTSRILQDAVGRIAGVAGQD